MGTKPGSLPAVVAEVARRQHGIVTRSQLLNAGLSSSGIKKWTASGRLHHIHRGVYAVGHPLISQEGRWLAAVLAVGRGAVLSHGPAGQLNGIVPRRERFALHVSVIGNADRGPKGIVTHRPRNLEARDTITRLAIPTTSATRTVWDLATVISSLQTRRAFEQAEKQHRLDRRRLTELLEESPSRKGAGVIRELLAERPLPLAETRSWLEELLVITCRDHGLPIPAVSVPLLGYEVDFLWPDARFVVEADGADHLNPGQRDRDNERDIQLGRAGYLVRRYSSRAMERSREVAAEVLEILTERVP
jgi:hypothetical protein